MAKTLYNEKKDKAIDKKMLKGKSPAVKKAGQVSITGKTATTPKGTKLTFL